MRSGQTLAIPVLVSRVLGGITSQLEDAAGVGPMVPSLAVWSNVIRGVAGGGSGGIDERALPDAVRISSRLATAAVTGSARRGWVNAEPASSNKNRRVRLTDLGEAGAEMWPARLAAVDDASEWSALRTVLEKVVGRLPFELSHFPASYGAADPSAVGGPFVSPSKKRDGLPAHGADWVPVRRSDGDTVSSLPLTALLSQTLMAFTIDYEDRFPWPLASTATVLCHIGQEPRPLAEVPGDHGIAGNGKSLLERHLIVTVTKDPADKRTQLVALTDRGIAVLEHHPARLEVVETEWRERFGVEVIAELRTALAPAATAAAPDTPDHVIAALHQG